MTGCNGCVCGQRRLCFPHWNLSQLNGFALSVRVWGSRYKRGRAAVLGVSNTHLKKSSARRLAAVKQELSLDPTNPQMLL